MFSYTTEFTKLSKFDSTLSGIRLGDSGKAKEPTLMQGSIINQKLTRANTNNYSSSSTSSTLLKRNNSTSRLNSTLDVLSPASGTKLASIMHPNTIKKNVTNKAKKSNKNDFEVDDDVEDDDEDNDETRVSKKKNFNRQNTVKNNLLYHVNKKEKSMINSTSSYFDKQNLNKSMISKSTDNHNSDLKRIQRNQIYALNELMTQLEYADFVDFCHENNIKI